MGSGAAVKSADGNAVVYFRDCRTVTNAEVPPDSVRLMVGASVYLGDAPWADYLDLYRAVYRDGINRLRDDGYLVVIQTDQYRGGRVVPRNALLLRELLDWGYILLDEKVWQRRKSDFFQPPFSMVWVLTPRTAKRPRGRDYLRGVWDFPQTAGGAHNAYPDELCRLLIESFTEPNDAIYDPFAGTARLLGRAATVGRRASGYEIDETLRETVRGNLDPGVVWMTPRT